MNDPLHDFFAARLDDAPEPSERMRERAFSALEAARRPVWTAAVLRYAAAVVIVFGGGGLAFSFVHQQTPPAETGVVHAPGERVALNLEPRTVERHVRVVLEVGDIAQTTRAIRAWPDATVRSSEPNDLHIALPSAKYRAALAQLAALGTLRGTTEANVDLGTALAEATSETVRAALRERIAVAHIDVSLESPSGT